MNEGAVNVHEVEITRLRELVSYQADQIATLASRLGRVEQSTHEMKAHEPALGWSPREKRERLERAMRSIDPHQPTGYA